jgi:predicted  nucleic acid-binding Zn-ribbon protein
MPHQCVRCNEFYEDGSTCIIDGCKCGSRLFFFIRQEKLDKLKQVSEEIKKLPVEEKKQIEKDVFSIMGADVDDEPVVLDLESIRITKPGKFEIDLVNLLNKDKPVVFKLSEGKYMIDIPETFRKKEKK